tara:strand:+ start:376 stop:513 length:138 start_codon:yes stop_codon:yes gene_type:complete
MHRHEDTKPSIPSIKFMKLIIAILENIKKIAINEKIKKLLVFKLS